MLGLRSRISNAPLKHKDKKEEMPRRFYTRRFYTGVSYASSFSKFVALAFGLALGSTLWTHYLSGTDSSSSLSSLSSKNQHSHHDPSSSQHDYTYKPAVKSVFEKSEMASLNDLKPDPEFVSSKKYKKMEKYIKSKYDFDTLRKNFVEKGFLVFKPNIPESVIEAAAEFTLSCAEEIRAGGRPDFHQDRFTDIEAVREIAQNYDIHAMLAVLHGHDPYPFQTLNFIKSSKARTHSDYIHFAAHPVILMSAAWVALMDISPDAGPVFYYEGSHKIPPFNMQDFGLEDRAQHHLNYAKYQDIMTAAMKKMGFKYNEAVVKKGEVFIWSANLVHGGPLANDPDLLRLSQVTHYFYRNSNYNWAPVASRVDDDVVTFYDEKAVDQKFGTEGTPEERRALSKFIIGPCDYMTKDKPNTNNIPNPCDIPHRIPKVLSQIFEHKAEKENYDVIM